MSHYAQVIDGIVQQVIVADAAFVSARADAADWIQTSYNTHHGQHRWGEAPLRKNYAGVGYSYDAELDAFIPPRPWASWVLNPDTADWEPPFPPPQDDQMWAWDEDQQGWTLWITELPEPEPDAEAEPEATE